MNRLKTFDDGSYMPLWQKDLEFIQEAFRQPIVKLCETLLGKASGIITGCKLTQNKGQAGMTISEGLVLMDGEIIYCPGNTISVNTAAYYLAKQDAYDPAGDKVFKVNDGTEVRQTYYKPVAVLTNAITIGGKFITLNEDGKKTLIERLYDMLFTMSLNYEIKTLNSFGGSGNVSIEYAQTGKQVHILSLAKSGGITPSPGISGDETGGGASTAAIPGSSIFTLPGELFPARDAYFTYQESLTSAMKLGYISATDGQIRIASAYEAIIAVAFSYLAN